MGGGGVWPWPLMGGCELSMSVGSVTSSHPLSQVSLSSSGATLRDGYIHGQDDLTGTALGINIHGSTNQLCHFQLVKWHQLSLNCLQD